MCVGGGGGGGGGSGSTDSHISDRYSECPTGFRELLSPSIDHLDVTLV